MEKKEKEEDKKKEDKFFMRTPGEPLPMPGEVVYSEEFLERRPQERGEGPQPLRVVQWNIERGYKMREIIAMLREADPDVATIQEIDIDCDRSENVDTLRTLAAALGMAYVFVAEFEELRSPARSARDQGGGVHGNCILSRFPLRGCRAIKHRHQIVDWDREGLARGEPRRGFRYTVTALVDVPGWGAGAAAAASAGPLRLYSSHLEVFCSAFQRVAQFCDVFDDSRASEAEDGARMQIVGGDLNTMGHGIARLSPKYCGHDWARFWTLGQSEGGWFARNVLHGEVKTEQAPQGPQKERRYNASLRWWGLPQDVCESAINNGFEDPYDVEKDITIESYAGWYYGKLDWTLLKGLVCTEKSLGNHDYSASDHKLLFIKVVPQ